MIVSFIRNKKNNGQRKFVNTIYRIRNKKNYTLISQNCVGWGGGDI